MLGNVKKSAVVVGPYRVHNFGDDLVGAIIAKRLQRLDYSVTVPCLGRSNCDWLGINFTETYDGVFEDAETIVVGGGGIMSDTSGAKPGASYLQIISTAAMRGRLTGKKVYVTSVGAGPWILEKSKMLAFGTAMIAEKIGVRDQESFDYLAGIGVEGSKVVLGSDCALLSADFLDFKPIPNKKIGIQLDTKQFDDIHQNPDLESISEALKEYIISNEPSIMLLSNSGRKSPLAQAAPNVATLEYNNLRDFLPHLTGLKAMFTSHLHLAITSYSQRIPIFSLYVRDKTKRFYDQIGRPERAVDLKTATLTDFKRFISAAETATWTDQDEETLQKLRSKAQTLLDLIK